MWAPGERSSSAAIETTGPRRAPIAILALPLALALALAVVPGAHHASLAQDAGGADAPKDTPAATETEAASDTATTADTKDDTATASATDADANQGSAAGTAAPAATDTAAPAADTAAPATGTAAPASDTAAPATGTAAPASDTAAPAAETAAPAAETGTAADAQAEPATNAATAAPANASASDLVKRGEYLTTAGDCAACHTGPDGTPFSGGLVLQTPFGGISTPNITPDKETGLGNWTEDDFYRVLHFGVGKDGEYIYPAMPYPNFTKVTKDDVSAIWAYLQTLEPVNAPRKPSTLGFPFNVREGLAAWNLLFFQAGTFEPDPNASDEVNRGAYLVEGLTHCGACHTPVDPIGGPITSEAYSGGKILGQPYYAPDITGGAYGEGLGSWSTEEIVTFLKTGAEKTKGTAFGPMEDAVKHSFSKLTDADLAAIAAYLKTRPDLAPSSTKVADTRHKQGAAVYMDNCSECHQASGKGITGTIPPLDANNAVTAGEPTDIITAVLGGLPGHGNYAHMPAFGAALDDQQIADVANFVRTSWSNAASANATPAMVASERAEVGTLPQASEAARSLGCPAITESGAANALPEPAKGILNAFTGVTDAEMANRVGELINEVRAGGTTDDASIVNTLLAAYCPIVAEDAALSAAQKHARLDAFTSSVEEALARRAPAPAGARILVQVPLPQDTVAKVDAAAKAAKETRQKWLSDAVSKAAEGTATAQ